MGSAFHTDYVWKLACEMARSGDYANVILIERELRRRGLLLGEHLTTNIVKRELLTRVCHAVRRGTPEETEEPDEPFRLPTALGFRPGMS
jgi:hypothetical protein